MVVIEKLGSYFSIVGHLASDPFNLVMLFSAVLMGIIFGAMPGLTATLGVALLTTLTYGMNTDTAMIALMSIYVGGVYGGSFASILINIPGTAAAAATTLDGYPLACKGEAGRAIGMTTTASAIGTMIGMLFVVTLSPIISKFALQFTSFEFFLLAFFGIIISGTLTSPDLVCKDWIAGWVSYGAANNSCIGRAMIPLLNLGIPGSPPAAMLLGALMLHGVNPDPMISFEHPTFILEITAILLLASLAMWVTGMLLAKQVVKVLRLPPQIFMPIIGSYALGMNIFNLFLMLPVGIVAYFLTEMGYPIAPLVIGVILGPMADENLRRALMVSKGSFLPMFTRPVSLILFITIVLTIVSQLAFYKKIKAKVVAYIRHRLKSVT